MDFSSPELRIRAETLNGSDTVRSIDLAREHGLSTQAVRNYEAMGVLPAARRTSSGYRDYTGDHARALRAYLALVAGHGHTTARAIMVAVVGGRTGDALELLDLTHADLLERRRVLDGVRRTLSGLTDVDTQPGPGIPVGALAHRLRVRPATLRRWERVGLLRPARDRAGYRVYSPADVRDARVVRELRRGGHPVPRIAPLLDELRAAGDATALSAALDERRDALTAQARAMLRGAGLLDAFLSDAGPATGSSPPPRRG